MQHVNCRSLIILFIFLSVQLTAQSYPDWFLHPQQFGDNCIVGYSIHGNDPVIDAERSLTAYTECIVTGQLEFYTEYDKDVYYRNSEYFYNFSPEALQKNEGRLVPHDAFLTHVFSNDIVVLFSTDSLFDYPVHWLNPDTMDAPEWTVRTFWEEDEYYYGVGTFTSRANPNDAWRTAEERAIFQILTSKVITVHNIRIMDTNDYGNDQMDEVSVLKLRFRLRNIDILRRWPDKKNRQFMVLVRIPQKDLFSPDLKNN